jgi:hypothetical protein
MRRLLASAVILSLTLGFHCFAGSSAGEVREALQALQDYIGSWKGNGTSEKDRSLIWNEKANWGWRFKGKDAWLTLDFPKSKNFRGGEMRYLPAKERYQLTLEDVQKKKLVFAGNLKKGRLTLERLDPESKETQRITMNTAAEGIRFIYTYSVKPENRTLFNQQYQVAFTKVGESLGTTGDKKPECVVTGGLGTMTVSYNGMTYYVCCSGCRDAFNENPAKIIKEYLARKKKRN